MVEIKKKIKSETNLSEERAYEGGALCLTPNYVDLIMHYCILRSVRC